MVGGMKRDQKPSVIDAEFEVISPRWGKPLPWWRRIYIDKATLLITAALAVVGLTKILVTGVLVR